MTMPTRTASFRVSLDGIGDFTINPSTDHLGTGGQGSVYSVGADRAIKIFHDPDVMTKGGMAGRVTALSLLTHPSIVGPRGLVHDHMGDPIGLFMPNLQGGEPFPSVATNTFRQQTGFGDVQVNRLVESMFDVGRYAHSNGALMVDPNMLSWLMLMVAGNPESRIIDVDSWSIGNYPPVAIMESIQDFHTQGFSELTDWFSVGVVAFELYAGIHPYRGRLSGYERDEVIRRMRDNASIFAPGVSLNKNVRDFSRIPGPLRDWFFATFQEGNRSVPPSPYATGVGRIAGAVVVRTIVTDQGALMYEKLYQHSDRAVRVFPCGVVLTEGSQLYDLESSKIIGSASSRDCEVIKKNGYWWILENNEGRVTCSAVSISSLEQEDTRLALNGHALLQANNRLFVHTNQGLVEIQVRDLGVPRATAGQRWGVMQGSTKMFDGVGIMDMMGSTILILPHGDQAVEQIRVPELDGLRPIAAKAGHRFVAILTVDPQGQYKKIELSFDDRYGGYRFWEGLADSSELNMAFLPRGVAAIIVEDGVLNIFVPSNGNLNKVQDRDITTDMTLGNWGNTVVYIRRGEVWSMSLR